jgi:uncharacterized protein (DUF362 family)
MGRIIQMAEHVVAVTRYEGDGSCLRDAVDLSRAFARMPRGARVFVKPNIVYWTKAVTFPKWGLITTSAVMEETIALLRDSGAGAITIGEGTLTRDRTDRFTQLHAFQSLGYNVLRKRYDVKTVDVFARPFRTVDAGGGLEFDFNVDALDSDFLVSVPVLKTHAQTVVSLAVKNLMGLLDVPSRIGCHSVDREKDLACRISRFDAALPPSAAIIDGIFSLERGPLYDGRPRRSDLIVASGDMFSADMAGARLLGYDPADVPHLVHGARRRGRSPDLSAVEIRGETLEEAAANHPSGFPYNREGTLPLAMELRGIKGVCCRRYDSTLCAYCSPMISVLLGAIADAWKGEPFGGVEILTGKCMLPAPGWRKTVLIGKCMAELHANNPAIREAIPVGGCPPDPIEMAAALKRAGIPVNEEIFRRVDSLPGLFLQKHAGRPGFDESFFRIT